VKTCNLCKGRGIVVKGEVAIPCKCMKNQAIMNILKISHLTPEMQKYKFENFNFKYYSNHFRDNIKNITYRESAGLAYKAAKKFVQDCLNNRASSGLLFTGQVGSGKTYLACCIANELIAKGSPVLFLVVPDFLDSIKATYNNANIYQYTEHELVDGAKQAPVLVMDDLGAHNYTEWTKNKLYSILNYRLNHCLPTVITTNISLEDLAEYLGERTTSRLFQMCRAYRLLVEVDIRIVQRQENENKAAF